MSSPELVVDLRRVARRTTFTLFSAQSLGSGLIFASAGYGVMSLVGGAVALLPLALNLWWRPRASRR